MKRYINGGISPEKLNLGVAAYGRSTAEMGPYTAEGGILGKSPSKLLNYD